MVVFLSLFLQMLLSSTLFCPSWALGWKCGYSLRLEASEALPICSLADFSLLCRQAGKSYGSVPKPRLLSSISCTCHGAQPVRFPLPVIVFFSFIISIWIFLETYISLLISSFFPFVQDNLQLVIVSLL